MVDLDTVTATAMAPSAFITHTAFWLLHMAVNVVVAVVAIKGMLVACCWVSGDFAFFCRNLVLPLDCLPHERSLAAKGDCLRGCHGAPWALQSNFCHSS